MSKTSRYYVKAAILALIIASTSLQGNGDSSFAKSNRYYLHAGGNQWSQPTAGLLDKVAIDYRAKKSLDFGVRFERTFHPKFYYAIALNYTQLHTYLQFDFNRNDFYPWFGSQENGPNRPLGLGVAFSSDCIGLSFNLGYEWINSKNWLIKTALGLHGAHFIAGSSGNYTFTEVQTINGQQYNVATIRLNQPLFNGGISDIADVKFYNPAFQIQGEVIHKFNRIHLGVGYNVNLGFRKLFRSRNRITFLPDSPEYRQVTTTEMNFNYWGMRFFLGF
jgi:hypothetical protein